MGGRGYCMGLASEAGQCGHFLGAINFAGFGSLSSAPLARIPRKSGISLINLQWPDKTRFNEALNHKTRP